ncbi:hypothetical protein MAPG_07535, partial [Magnaporthiopsis poae ATCC 64411]
MSLIESPSASTRDQIHSSPKQDDGSSSTYTESTAAAAHPTTSRPHHRQDSFDDVIYQEFYQALEEHRQQPVTKSNMAAVVLQESSPIMFEASASDTSSTPASPPVPPLPSKNARRSRMLDGMVLKLDTRREAATPHDVYLSSEEDASSSADDFSDYDWESSSEVDLSEGVEVCEAKLATSPTSSSGSSPAVPQPRRSHEITARAVAVVFSGKPAIIELSSCSRRCTSASDTHDNKNTNYPSTPTAPTESTNNLASSASSVMTAESSTAEDESHYNRPLSTRTGSLPSNNSSTSNLSFSRRMSASSASSAPSRSTADKMNRRQSSNTMLTAMLNRQQPPPFLSIDPYANGSTYSLNSSPARKSSLSVVSPPVSARSEESPAVTPITATSAATPKTPKTPTALFKEFSRSFSNTLNRKRSRQSLIGISTPTSSLRETYVLSSSMPPINDDSV